MRGFGRSVRDGIEGRWLIGSFLRRRGMGHFGLDGAPRSLSLEGGGLRLG